MADLDNGRLQGRGILVPAGAGNDTEVASESRGHVAATGTR
jgi:hypothetical protein